MFYSNACILKLSRTNVASVGSVFNNTRKVKVLSLPETIKEKIDVSSEGPSSGVKAVFHFDRIVAKRSVFYYVHIISFA